MKKRLLLILGLITCATYAQEASFTLVKDANTTGDAIPANTISYNNKLFYIADDGVNGQELWVSDGTEEGTFMIKDINPGANGSFPDQLKGYNGNVIFTADNGVNGNEVWITNGTEAGTSMLKDVFTGDGSSYSFGFTDFAGKLYFRSEDSRGTELWVTDGTPAGTTIVKDIRVGEFGSNPQYLTVMDDKLYFNANDGFEEGQHGFELWATDGTEAGTALVKDINPTESGNPGDLIAFNGNLYFTANNGESGIELYKSDGTEAGTGIFMDIAAGAAQSLPSHFVKLDNVMCFSAYTTTTGREMWRTDGTVAGTYMLIDAYPGSTDGLIRQFDRYAYNNKFYFCLQDLMHGWEVWVSDGTTAGTTLLKDIFPGTDGSISNAGAVRFYGFNGRVYFRAMDNYDTFYQLFSTDGTEAGTVKILPNAGNTDFNPLGYNPFFAGMGDSLYLTANHGTTGIELWKYTPGIMQAPGFTNAILSYYPNPVSDVLHITAQQKISGITVYNIQGQQLLQQEVNGTNAAINLSGLANGVYILNAATNTSSQTQTIRIVKE